jgi:hypothetical protein
MSNLKSFSVTNGAGGTAEGSQDRSFAQRLGYVNKTRLAWKTLSGKMLTSHSHRGFSPVIASLTLFD